MNARRVRELIVTAQGRKKAEVVIENIQLVNVYSREIHPSFSVGLSQDRIAYLGPAPGHLVGPKTQVVDGGGNTSFRDLSTPIPIWTVSSPARSTPLMPWLREIPRR
jgi:hypothetical protein